VRDGNGQQLAYIYFEDEPGRRLAAKLLAQDEARRIAGKYREAAEDIAQARLVNPVSTVTKRPLETDRARAMLSVPR